MVMYVNEFRRVREPADESLAHCQRSPRIAKFAPRRRCAPDAAQRALLRVSVERERARGSSPTAITGLASARCDQSRSP
eukprot:COSAG06_NODE_1845_length_8230_cov_12.038499_4_plen_79_part_00